MKPSELRKLYLSIANLYGVMTSDHMFSLLDRYDIPYNKKSILKDLKRRCQKLTNHYFIQQAEKSLYLIIDPAIPNEEFEDLLKQKTNKPVYFPDTYEELLKYSDELYNGENAEELFDRMFSFIADHSKLAETNIAVLLIVLFKTIRRDVGNFGTKVNKFIEAFKLDVKSKNALDKFLQFLKEANNNLRHIANNGFTPKELYESSGPIDTNRVTMSIGPNMKKAFLNGDMDPNKYLEELETSDLPASLKESLKKELIKIIKESNKVGRA